MQYECLILWLLAMACGIKFINYSILIFAVVLALLIIVVIIKFAGIVPKK